MGQSPVFCVKFNPPTQPVCRASDCSSVCYVLYLAHDFLKKNNYDKKKKYILN